MNSKQMFFPWIEPALPKMMNPDVKEIFAILIQSSQNLSKKCLRFQGPELKPLIGIRKMIRIHLRKMFVFFCITF